jgi:WhiB family transcriptional regulator, redox-sensing transcriptional regulator
MGGVRTRATTPSDSGWQLRAACRDESADGSWEIEPDGKPSQENRAALAVCEGCPVRQACLDFALALEGSWPRWGIYGGTLPRDREHIARTARRSAD